MNEWCGARVETIVIGNSTRGLKVQFSGFSRQELNAIFKEKSDEEVQGKPTFWDPTGTYFIYWQQSMSRWAILDKASLHLAKSGLAPGWAYRTDCQHFARANTWMEVWGKDWKETTVRCQIIEGSVREAFAPVKAEVKEDSAPLKLSAQQLRNLVKKVYEAKNPAKLSGLGAIYTKYDGREQELLTQVCHKYGVDPEKMKEQFARSLQESIQTGATAAAPSKAAAVENREDQYAHIEEEDIPDLKAGEFAVLVQAVYEHFNPKKLQDMPRLLRKYSGRERDLYLEVCKKYGAHAAKFYAKHRDEHQMAEPA